MGSLQYWSHLQTMQHKTFITIIGGVQSYTPVRGNFGHQPVLDKKMASRAVIIVSKSIQRAYNTISNLIKIQSSHKLPHQPLFLWTTFGKFNFFYPLFFFRREKCTSPGLSAGGVTWGCLGCCWGSACTERSEGQRSPNNSPNNPK